MNKTVARRKELLRVLAVEGEARVDRLATTLQIAPATVRRDLQLLAEAGRVIRTYGGAVLPGPQLKGGAEEVKRAIARRAALLVEEGETIIITSGTTTLALARELSTRSQLTVITNAIDVVQVLLDRPGIELVVLGGTVRPRMHSLLGHLTALCAREVRADWLMMGTTAIHPEHGLMNDHSPEILTDRVLKDVASRVAVLADSTKFSGMAPGFVFPVSDVDTLVTDADAPPELLHAISARGVQVLQAEPVDGES